MGDAVAIGGLLLMLVFGARRLDAALLRVCTIFVQ
jgi:hypothetical protein